LYGCGLRVSEVIALTTADIDSSAMHLIVRTRNGKIDRLLPLPIALLEDIRKYCLEYDPKQYLFEGKMVENIR
ncbi:MAG: tyrosine-type recombinase/integrase, partial [Flavobacteriaceae bacterium]